MITFLHFIYQFEPYEVCVVPYEGAPKRDIGNKSGVAARMKDALRD